MATAKVRAACLAPPSELAPHLPRVLTSPNDSTYTLLLISAKLVGPDLQHAIYSMFDTNMSPISENSSMTYTETSKREELFHEDTRFLLLLALPAAPASMPGSLPPSTTCERSRNAEKGLDLEEDGELVGYCSFRFDTEETLEPRDAEVIYCYELQLAGSVRGQGVGKVLMDEMERIGRERKVDKAMLTCLKRNTTALSFYSKYGYETDEIDPTRMAADEEWEDVGADQGVEVDYNILSKSLKNR